MPTVSLTMIVKDVANIIGRCLDSVVPFVDEIIIVDTGSSDETKKVILQHAPQAKILDFNYHTHPESFLIDRRESWEREIPGPFSYNYMLADFGAARQIGWAAAKGDFLMWLDSDDVLENGENLTELLSLMDRTAIDVALINYDYAFDAHGKPSCKLRRERIVRRALGTRWTQPVHEVLMPGGSGNFYDQINVKHMRQDYGLIPTIQNRNLKILLHWLNKNKDNPNPDPRMLFYLALEERFVWPEDSIRDFTRYVKASGWDEERGLAHCLSGTMHERAGRYQEAFAEYAQAHLEFPANPDGLFGAARIAYHREDWNKCIEYTERGFKFSEDPDRPTVLMYDPLDRSLHPYVYYSVALVNTSQYQRALWACNKGLLQDPKNPYLIGNKEVALAHLDSSAREDVPSTKTPLKIRFPKADSLTSPAIEMTSEALCLMIIQVWKKTLEENGPEGALRFLDQIPSSVKDHPRIQAARRVSMERASTVMDQPMEQALFS